METNTTPKPTVQFQPNTTLQEDNLAIPSTNLNPNLKVPPWPPKTPSTVQEQPQRTDATSCCCLCDPSLEKRTDPGMAAATAGRTAPSAEHPTAKTPVPNELRPVSQENPPCYLPQPEDATMSPQEMEMGPIGPWATGRLDWGPLAGLTGTRPVVDKYSITRYSEGEWRKHNKDILDMAQNELHRSNL